MYIRLSILMFIALASLGLYLGTNFNLKYFDYVMSIRLPKISAIVISSLCIAFSSLVFQTLVNNLIVTPSLLGMNALYLLIHTSVVFFLGVNSSFVYNQINAFILDLALMLTISFIVYGYIFKKTKSNILYILLIGSVLSTFFLSLQMSMIRAMDPNDYDVLLKKLVASFSNINEDLLLISASLVVFLLILFKDDLKDLNVIALGRDRAINLGINYNKRISRLLILITILISIATALIGPLSFLGLLCTNVSRLLFKTYKHKFLILGSIFIAIIFLSLCLIIVERVFIYAIPVSVFVTIFGGIYFLYLILKLQKESV